MTRRPSPRRSQRAPRRSRTRQPKPPFPAQHQSKPGHESRLKPAPRYQAPAYRAAGKLEGRAALITGGDSGIGRAVALLFAREGADIALVYLPEERDDAMEIGHAIESLGRRVVHIPGDLRRAAFCRRAVETAAQQLGTIDILVNNAAFQQHQKSLDALPDEQLKRTVETNIYGMFALTRAALAHMTAGGAIINTGSITGLDGSPELLDYSATKGAIHAFTKSLAQSLVDRQIRVNCVAPGPVWTPLNPSDRPATVVSNFGHYTTMGRPAQPEEIAPAFVFFASNADSSYITGEVLTLLGGDTTAG
jgi:NAD(P)-dependent dehydrogenase (short-subunit alcohol dehydrogenase family)